MKSFLIIACAIIIAIPIASFDIWVGEIIKAIKRKITMKRLKKETNK